MKVKTKIPFYAVDIGVKKRGDVFEIPDHTAKELIVGGYVVAVQDTNTTAAHGNAPKTTKRATKKTAAANTDTTIEA